MSLQCIVDLGGIQGISRAVVDGCDGTLLRVWKQNNKAMIYRTDEELSLALLLSSGLPLVIELVHPFGSEIIEVLKKNPEQLMIASEDKEIIHEMYISRHTLTLGVIELPRSCLELTPSDFFISFVILNYATLRRDVVERWMDNHPSVKIYVRGVYTEESVRHCKDWNVYGIITNRNKIVQKYL